MKNKILVILFILILSVLYISSCQDQQKQPEAVSETTSETVQETESEPAEPDLDLEIAQNYSNTVVSAQVAIDYMKKSDECYVTNDKLDSITYYNTVKTLGSTGKNISDSTYLYEWVLDNGTYLHAKFYRIFENDGQTSKPLKQKGGTVPANSICAPYMTSYTLDPDLIKSNYPDYSTYLYESFFTEEFESYDEFFEWFGYKELPTVKEAVLPTPTVENVEAIRKRLANRAVDKARAINVKPGMTVYEAINFVGSLGYGDATYYHAWKVDDNFVVQVAITDDDEAYQHIYEQVITSVEFRTSNPNFVMLDQLEIN